MTLPRPANGRRKSASGVFMRPPIFTLKEPHTEWRNSFIGAEVLERPYQTGAGRIHRSGPVNQAPDGTRTTTRGARDASVPLGSEAGRRRSAYSLGPNPYVSAIHFPGHFLRGTRGMPASRVAEPCGPCCH